MGKRYHSSKHGGDSKYELLLFGEQRRALATGIEKPLKVQERVKSSAGALDQPRYL